MVDSISVLPLQTADSGLEATEVNGNHSSDSPYIRELQKQIRNVTKKLGATAKLNAVLAENPQSSLDDLLAAKKINADQKAQALKKPALQAQLSQLEEQLSQYKQVDSDYQSRMSSELKSLQDKHEAELAKARSGVQEDSEAKTIEVVKQKFLLFSRFLRAAAAKRISEEEADTEESKAFEGALLLVYGGDDKAVQAAQSIVDGTDEIVPSVEGQPTTIKYSQLKELTLQHTSDIPDGTSQEAESEADKVPDSKAGENTTANTSDPTIANAGLTELADATMMPVSAADAGSEIPAQSSTGAEGANDAAGRAWNGTSSATNLEGSEESFEIVPRDPAETDVGKSAQTDAPSSSWADDAAEAAANAPTVAVPDKDDGFHEVHGRRGGHRGHRGDGEGRGRGRGGRGRGGFERGRGGFRGGRGGGGGGEGRGRGRGAPRGS